MIELRWVGSQLQYRVRDFEVDASTHFCGLTDFGDWMVVPGQEVTVDFYIPPQNPGSINCG